MAFPFGFKGCDVDNDSAASVSAFTQTNRQNAAWNSEIFDGARQRKRVWRDDANITVEVDKRFFVESFWVNNCRIDVSENLKLVSASYVIAVTAGAITHNTAFLALAHLARLKGLDHSFRGFAAYPSVAHYAHGFRSDIKAKIEFYAQGPHFTQTRVPGNPYWLIRDVFPPPLGAFCCACLWAMPPPDQTNDQRSPDTGQLPQNPDWPQSLDDRHRRFLE